MFVELLLHYLQHYGLCLVLSQVSLFHYGLCLVRSQVSLFHYGLSLVLSRVSLIHYGPLQVDPAVVTADAEMNAPVVSESLELSTSA